MLGRHYARAPEVLTPADFARAASGLFQDAAMSLDKVASYSEVEAVAAISCFPHQLKNMLQLLSDAWSRIYFNTDAVDVCCLRPNPSVQKQGVSQFYVRHMPDDSTGPRATRLRTLAGICVGRLDLRPDVPWADYFNLYDLLDLWQALRG
jgi:hypothetical protein